MQTVFFWGGEGGQELQRQQRCAIGGGAYQRSLSFGLESSGEVTEVEVVVVFLGGASARTPACRAIAAFFDSLAPPQADGLDSLGYLSLIPQRCVCVLSAPLPSPVASASASVCDRLGHDIQASGVDGPDQRGDGEGDRAGGQRVGVGAARVCVGRCVAGIFFCVWRVVFVGGARA